MHSLGSEIAPNRASDLSWSYYACRILLYFFQDTIQKKKHNGKDLMPNGIL